ncbi:ATP-grasp domain-containing protein [Liquorilactobacillus nagelii]|uniref:ATP-grasp domain-containing protein n=1 Tax=Liquorilactobacillus nagelii TaxID=82688 RepID=UPI002430872A|nr:ATP-grasp domain-containing protein [Liquorilactobacillus nagelii]MCI1633945.1 ATP-grasp domain-containing protein [Liquorilactobacillus nagelii]
MKKLLVLVEPYFHGIQYLDIALSEGLDFLVLRRKDGPSLKEYKNVLIVDIDDPINAVTKLKDYMQDNGYTRVGIIPGNDFVVPFAFNLAEKLELNYNTYETGRAARNKFVMYQRMSQVGVSVPDTIRVTNEKEIPSDISFPLIVKPEDMSSSMYVYKVNNQQELKERVTATLRLNDNILGYNKSIAVLLQEFSAGPEFSIELFMDQGEAVYSSVTQKQKTPAPYFVELGHVIGPININVSQNNELITEAVKSAKAIGLQNGPAHVEIVLNEQQGPVVIEIAARIGGDNIQKLVREAYGIYLPELAIRQVLGEPFNPNKQKWSGAAVRFITTKAPGEITCIKGWDSVRNDPNFIEGELEFNVGDVMKNIESSDDRVGYVIAKGTTGKEAKENAARFEGMIDIETKW